MDGRATTLADGLTDADGRAKEGDGLIEATWEGKKNDGEADSDELDTRGGRAKPGTEDDDDEPKGGNLKGRPENDDEPGINC